MTCWIRGPYYPAGAIDWECAQHHVLAELKDPSKYGSITRREDWYCPMDPERTRVTYSISYERFTDAVEKGALAFGIFADQIGPAYEDFLRAALDELNINIEPKPVNGPIEALLQRLEGYANVQEGWGETTRALELRAVAAELREVLANDEH